MTVKTGKDLYDEITRLEAELAKAKTVPMKYRRMAFNAQLQDEVKKLEAENAALKADAERYRFIVSKVKEIRYLPVFADQPDPTYIKKWVYELRDEYGGSIAHAHANESLDAAIDAAREEQKN